MRQTGLRGRGNFYQVQVLFAGQFERLKGLQDSDLLTFIANHANFARSNTIIGAYKTLIDTNLRPLSNGVGMKDYSISRQPPAISGQGDCGHSVGPMHLALGTSRLIIRSRL